MGQLIHVNFTREVVRSRSEPAIRTLPQRRLAVVKLNILIREVVLHLNPCATGVVIVKLPRSHCAIVLHTRADFDHACRTKVSPTTLFLARTDEVARPPPSARQSRCVDRALAGVLASISGTHVRRDYTYFFF